MLEEQEVSSESETEFEQEFIDAEINVESDIADSDIAEYRELLELIEAGWILYSISICVV